MAYLMAGFQALLMFLVLVLLAVGAVKALRWALGIDEQLRLLREISRKLGADPAPVQETVLARLKGRLSTRFFPRTTFGPSSEAIAAASKIKERM